MSWPLKSFDISIYVRQETENPSNYYRIFQYIDVISDNYKVNSLLKKHEYRFYLDTTNKVLKVISNPIFYSIMLIRLFFMLLRDLIVPPRIIFVQREFIPRYCPKLILFMITKLMNHSELIWDIDDDILESKEISKNEFNILKSISKIIIVSTNYLRNMFSDKNQQNLVVIPTIDGTLIFDDFDKLLNKRLESYDKEIILVWVATANNLVHLESIIPELDSAAKELKLIGKRLILKVICNKKLVVISKFLEVKNIKWKRNRLLQELVDSHIGIMPLEKTKFALGKASFKIYQYLSCSLPVIASDVGNNKEILNKDIGFLIDEKSKYNWVTNILKISKNIDEYKQMSLNVYKFWEKSNFINKTKYSIFEILCEKENL